MATLAVFIGLTGTAWALANNSVESKHIVNGEVKSVDVKDDDLEGADIDESSLDSVPEADQLDGIEGRAFRYVRDIDASPANETVFQLDDFEMQARCGETTPGNASLIIDTISHKNNASLSATTPDGATTDINNDMDDGELEVLSGDAYSDGNGPNTLVYVSPNTTAGIGDGGDVTTVQFMADENDALAGRECVLAGIAFQRDFPVGIPVP